MAEISVVLVMLVAVVLSEAITKVLLFAVPLPLVQIALGILLGLSQTFSGRWASYARTQHGPASGCMLRSSGDQNLTSG